MYQCDALFNVSHPYDMRISQPTTVIQCTERLITIYVNLCRLSSLEIKTSETSVFLQHIRRIHILFMRDSRIRSQLHVFLLLYYCVVPWINLQKTCLFLISWFVYCLKSIDGANNGLRTLVFVSFTSINRCVYYMDECVFT